MRPVILFLIIALLCDVTAAAQRQNVWAFGTGGGLDFNTSPPSAITTSISTTEGCASVCDLNGQLLFYTNGSIVYNRNHVPMPNGNNLTGLSPNATASTSQGALIIPHPDHPNRYYIFSLSDNALTGDPDKGKLYYSVADLSLNNGLGDIVSSEKGILIDSMLTEQMTAVAADQCGVWLLNLSLSWQLRARFIDASGIATAPVVSMLLQPAIVDPWNMIGCMDMSGDGHKLALARRKDLTLYDFNQATGTAGNGLLLSSTTGPALTAQFYSVCFSPDNSKLYLTDHGPATGLYQFDLSLGSAAQVIASKTQIAQPPNCAVKKGPDNKLYVSEFGQNALHVVNNPDAAGLACQYLPLAVPLAAGTSCRIGLPNTVPAPVSRPAGIRDSVYAPCFATQYSITAADTAGWQYLWNDGDTGKVKQVYTPGRYMVRYYTPCFIHTDTIDVGFPYPLPGLLIQPACYNADNGRAFAITNGAGAYSFTWTNNMNDTLSLTDSLSCVSAGSYTLYIHTANGCDTLLPVAVPQVQYPLSWQSDTLSCAGDALSFQNTSDSHYTEFRWFSGDNQFSNQRDAMHTYTQGGQYTVVLTGAGAICRDTVYREITVDNPFTEPGFIMDRKKICMGESITFDPETDSTVVQLIWSFGTDHSLYSSEGTRTHAFDQAGNIPVTLITKFRVCPSVTVTDTVAVYPFPLADLGPDQSLCLQGDPVLLANLHPSTADLQYLWNTGDTSSSLSVYHPGVYSLRITNAYGCATTESITLNKDCYTDIPNAFTPNNDGENDYFYPRQLLSRGATHFKMTIWNRWGQKIFDTYTIDGRGWDGRFNGKEQPQGVYIYLMEIDFKNKTKESYKGNVTLLR